MNTAQKNNTLQALANLILQHKEEIISRNKKDIADCGNLDASLLDRLKVDAKKVDGMAQSVKDVMALDDPEGKLIETFNRPNGLRIENRTVPFGRILIIYESRPDVTIESAITAFKAGNKILLKGGKEAKNTNLYLVELWHQALTANGLDTSYVSYLDLNREATQQLIKDNTEKIDLVLPRGGEGLINFVKTHATMPVIVSGRGNNFLYIDDEADFEMALRIGLNGKLRLSVCNALDKVLINRNITDLQTKIDRLASAFQEIEMVVYGDELITPFNNSILPMESPEMFSEEFLSAKILFGLVNNMDEAIEKINRYSGGHTAIIVTANNDKAKQFLYEVDCAAVNHNASSRFTDGGQFGLGAEIAISTQKLHFRGPLGRLSW